MARAFSQAAAANDGEAAKFAERAQGLPEPAAVASP
jgi:hypothetical protein